MKMTSVSGHLLNHEFETKYRKWYSCAPAQLFDLPVSKICPNESANNIKRTLEKEVRKQNYIKRGAQLRCTILNSKLKYICFSYNVASQKCSLSRFLGKGPRWHLWHTLHALTYIVISWVHIFKSKSTK